MSASLKVDQREFNATMHKLAQFTSRDMPVFLNSRLYHVAKKARTNTPAADRQKILSDLGGTLVSEKMGKRGMRRKYAYKPTKLVYKLVNAARIRSGLYPLFDSSIDAHARKFIAGRLRSVGTLKAGWNRALGILGAAIRQFAGKEGPNVRGNSKAKPAVAGKYPQSELEYVLRTNNKIHPSVVRALDLAFNQERAEMLAHLDKKMNEVARKAGAK